jgi:hypothetical protein
LEFRRFRKRADCEAERARVDTQPGGIAAAPESGKRLATFKNHTVLCCELIDWVVERQIPGTFAFDSYFTNAAICNHLAGHARAYVGDLKFNRKVWFRGAALRAEEVAAQIPVADRKKVTIGERTQWYFTKKIWLPDYTHAVRIVILWERWNGKAPCEDPDYQSNPVGSDPRVARSRAALDRHGDPASGRQAAFGLGRLSTAQRRGPDAAFLPRVVGA